MAGWKLFTGNRTEVLFERLAEILSQPLPTPWEQEIILVQSRGMERWLSLGLAERFGIWANARFPFPNAFVQELVARLLGVEAPEEAFHRDVMTWRISGALSALIGRVEFTPLRAYLGSDPSPMRRYQICSRIADAFDQYLVYRPDMMERWETGRDDQWQAVLWRELAAGGGGLHRARIRGQLMERLAREDLDVRQLPSRVSLFGISILPPFHLGILERLARTIPVNVFVMNPCREFWFDILPDRAIARRSVQDERLLDAEEQHLVRENGLLASMGAMGGEFFKLLLDFEAEQVESFQEPGGRSLLGQIQADILDLRDVRGGPKRLIGSDDRSVQIHSCHGPTREVEVLLDTLLRLLEEDPDLSPEDILVMAPDIESYAAVVDAVFGGRGLAYNLSDRTLMGESRLMDAFFLLLSLSDERFRVLAVMDLLEAGPVKSRLGLRDEELSRVRQWVEDLRIKWGIDDRYRGELGLPADRGNTWRQGMGRLMLGYALSGGLFRGLLPYGGVEGSRASVLGSLAPFMEDLFEFGHTIRRSRSLGQWSELLSQAVDSFFASDRESESELDRLHAAVQSMADMEDVSGFRDPVPVEVVRSWLRRRLERQISSSGFLSGGVTFCSMLPMRAIPFDVICLLGMNDGAYPRIVPAVDFDLIAQDPRLGDRSRKDDDRYLFLEALLSARKVFCVSYAGQSVEDNSALPPSVLVSELVDYVREGFALEGGVVVKGAAASGAAAGMRAASGAGAAPALIIGHRLQAFHPLYFQRGAQSGSYSEENYRICRRLLAPGGRGGAPGSGALGEPEESFRIVDVEDLAWFLRNPARLLCHRRLGFLLREPEEEPEEREPFRLQGLDRYVLARELVEALRGGVDPRGLLPEIRARGVLPHGSMGELEFRSLVQEAEELVGRVEAQQAGQELEPLELDREIGGFRLTGLIGCSRDALIRWRPAKAAAADTLGLWVHHLALNAASEPGYPNRSLFVGKDRVVELRPVDGAEDRLHVLLDWYWRALQRIVKLFPETSLTYAERFAKSGSRKAALSAADKKWTARFGRPEAEDPYFRRFFGDETPLDAEFQDTAETLLLPLLECRETRK